jgi:hypothetical protein
MEVSQGNAWGDELKGSREFEDSILLKWELVKGLVL